MASCKRALLLKAASSTKVKSKFCEIFIKTTKSSRSRKTCAHRFVIACTDDHGTPLSPTSCERPGGVRVANGTAAVWVNYSATQGNKTLLGLLWWGQCHSKQSARHCLWHTSVSLGTWQPYAYANLTAREPWHTCLGLLSINRTCLMVVCV